MPTYRSCLARALIVLVSMSGPALACGERKAPSDLEPSSAAPDPRGERDDPQPEAPANQEDEDEPLVAGVVVLEEGRGPREVLAWAPSTGTRRRLVMGLRVNVRTGQEPAPLSPRVRLMIDAELENVTPSGVIRRAFEIAEVEIEEDDRVDPEAIESMREIMQPLAGKKGVVESDAFEAAADPIVTGALSVDPRVHKFVASFRHAWSHLAIPLPEAPVGTGAKWKSTRRIDVHGIDAWQIATYKLVKREGQQIEVEGKLAYRLADAEHQPVGFDAMQAMQSLEAEGTFTARLDLATATPIEAHVGLSASFEGEGDGAPVAGKIGLDLTIDEDWLAQRDERVQLRGRFVRGGVVWGTVPPQTKVWFNRRRIALSDEGDFLIGFDRDGERKALLSFAFPGGAVERHVIFIQERRFETESIDGLPDEMVNPPREAKREMAAARKVIEQVRHAITRTAYFRGGFQLPTRGRITSTYGRPRVLNGQDSGYHWGIDIAAPVGTRVKAPAAGKVVFTRTDLPLSGSMLVLDHGYGLTSSFLHLAKIKVEVGDEVKRGQVIATVGKSGRATGPHLDWRMNLLRTRIDPQLALEW